MSRKFVLRAALAAACLAPATGACLTPAIAAAATSGPTFTDHAIIARDIVPSGQPGAVPPPAGADRQAQMYDDLTPLFNKVSTGALNADFKAESLGATGPGPYLNEPVPHSGVTIKRDAFDVPHIFGKTRDDVTWGSGWVLAEDRGLLLQQARYDSRVAAIDVPGVKALDLISNLETFKPSAQTEREVAKQTGALLAKGAKGRAVLHDIDVYLAGINAYFRAHGGTTPTFTRTDIYAFAALKGQFVGQGGGDEPVRSEFLTSLQHKFGATKGRKIWNDLREANDPEAPASVPGKVRFQKPPHNDSGNVDLDPGSLSASATQAIAASNDERVQASNDLMVSGERSSTHHPIMVAGPQIGYFYPGLTLEEDLEGPGISQRGVSSAPFPGYIFIGRSQDFGWSLTSAGLDQIDTFVETLCGHSVHKYMFKGRCSSMQFFDAGTLNPGTTSAKELSFYRTVNGPVVGYARVHGRLVALARKRASYGKDALDLLFYHDLAHDRVHNVHQFFRAANQTPQTFNSFYVDDKDIGVFTSGLVPIRPSNVDPAMPINGNGKEEWKGSVSFKNHPKGINPPSGEIINWNNRPQAGYEAPDDNWSLGALQRVDLLISNLGRGKHITPAKVVSAMNAAATQDVREMTFEPILSKLLHGGKAPNARDAKMLSLLDQWRHKDGSRLDRTDKSGIGNITSPGAAIMDKSWPLLATAWASSVLGPKLSAQLASFVSPFDQPPKGQYAGWHIYMDKDLRTLMKLKVRGKYNVRYCGAGNLKRCRPQLWKAIDKAGEQLATAQGSNASKWRVSADPERIGYVPGILPYTMRYTNRPSGIQQILSFSGHSQQDTGR